MPISPSGTLGLLFATFCGTLAHLILDGGGRSLLMLILAAWVGFALGQAVGEIMDIATLSIGPTRVFTGVLGALVAIATARLLMARRLSDQ